MTFLNGDSTSRKDMPKRKNITTTIAELQTSQSSFVTTQTLDQKLTRKESPLKSLKTPTVTSKVFADTCTTPISSQTSIPKESPLKSIRLTPKVNHMILTRF
ncbi:uncharacterized protein [Ptychodera flava]|uniref:uncharacterized protein isoform X1 n=1 Tax=Ptychodera flava TaxID=63121 RepID=UPI00396A5B0C